MSKKEKKERFPPDDILSPCPVCKTPTKGFINISYGYCYTIRCEGCEEEFDFTTKERAYADWKRYQQGQATLLFMRKSVTDKLKESSCGKQETKENTKRK
jgi:hypothetical protein